MHISYLEWDSHCFGYQVGEINTLAADITPTLQQARRQGYRLLYLKTPPNDTSLHLSAIYAGGIWVDEKITFLQKIPAYIPQSQALVYEALDASADLKTLALQSGQFSRFKTDARFQNNEFEKLYTAWIENSLKKELAERVLIVTLEEKTVGLLTLGIKNQRADIGILAVDEPYRRQGIGKALLYSAFQQSKQLQQSVIQVITQKANAQACRFYQKQGFAIEKTENIYHFWLD